LFIFADFAALPAHTSTDVNATLQQSCRDLLPQGLAEVAIAEELLHSFPLHSALECGQAAVDLSVSDKLFDIEKIALFVEAVARHPACVSELVDKGEAETRCAQKWYKIAIHFLTGDHMLEAAEAMWTRARRLGINWPSARQTPTVWLTGLRSATFWDCGAWPFVRDLEAAAPQILEEALGVGHQFMSAYPYLTQRGVWNQIFMYRGRDWNRDLCAAMPSTCTLLIPELPTKPGVPPTTVYNEEIVLFRSEPGASVGAHCGSSNNAINIHLTLTGASGTRLRVDSEERELRDGKAVCFQDSYSHAIEHSGDGVERISLVVRVMHPDMNPEVYTASGRTDVVDLRHWDTQAELASEVARMRAEYRRLARDATRLED
jgi:hypothetical protein